MPSKFTMEFFCLTAIDVPSPKHPHKGVFSYGWLQFVPAVISNLPSTLKKSQTAFEMKQMESWILNDIMKFKDVIRKQFLFLLKYVFTKWKMTWGRDGS